MKDEYIKKFSGHSLAQTFLMRNSGGMFVRKEVSDTDELGIAKLEKQYEWLHTITKTFPGRFPRTLSSRKDAGYFAYHMEYSPWQSVSDLVRSRRIHTDEIQHIISSVASFCFEDLFHTHTPSAPAATYVFTEVILKLNKRIEKAESISEDFKTFNEASCFYLNGKMLRSKHQVFDIFQDEAILARLRPQALGHVHGDLTFANILTDGKEFLLIDPRGEGADSYFYDMGKLYQSMVCGLEGMLRGEYDILIEGASVRSFPKHVGIQSMTEDDFFSFWEKKPYISGEPNWKAKVLFFAAAHFIGAVPFRLYADELETAILFYVQGLDLLERVIQNVTNQNEQIHESRISQGTV